MQDDDGVMANEFVQGPYSFNIIMKHLFQPNTNIMTPNTEQEDQRLWKRLQKMLQGRKS